MVQRRLDSLFRLIARPREFPRGVLYTNNDSKYPQFFICNFVRFFRTHSSP